MKGHIRKRGKESWAIILDIGQDNEGKRRQKWHSVKGTKKDAERELTKLLHTLDSGSYIEPSKLTVSRYLKTWLSDYAAHQVTPKTLERYQGIISDHINPAIGHHPLTKLKPPHIQELYTKSLKDGRLDGKGGLAPRTVLHMHRVLHKALDQAMKWQMLIRNPTEAVVPPKPKTIEMAALDEDQVARLLEHFRESRLYLPILIAVTTGLRRGEILALKWQNIQLSSARLHVRQSLEQTKEGLRFKSPKTEKSKRTVILPRFTVEALKEHRKRTAERKLKLGKVYQDNDLVCAREDGTIWPPDTLSTLFAARIKKAPVPKIRFHDLRHTHATQLLKQGVHPKIVSERLGHSNISITLDTYSHVLPGMQEEAIAVFDRNFKGTV